MAARMNQEECMTVDLAVRKTQLYKALKIRQLSVKVDLLQNDTECQIGFKILELTQLYTLGESTVFNFYLPFEYLCTPPYVAYFSLVGGQKGRRQEIGTQIYVILNDYYGCQSESFEAILLTGDYNAKIFVTISVLDVVQKNQPAQLQFDLINGKEQEQLMIYTQLSSAFRLINHCSQYLILYKVDVLQQMLSVVDYLFPGMNEDFYGSGEQISALNMYSDMMSRAVDSNYLESTLSSDYRAKVVEMFDALFLPQQNVFLYKDVLVFPIDIDNQYMQRLLEVLREQLSQNFLIVPVYIKSAEDYLMLSSIFVLLSLLYNLFRVLANPLRGNFATTCTLYEWLCGQETDDVYLADYNYCQFQGLGSELAEEVKIRYYIVENSFALQTHIKVLFFNQDDSCQKALFYDAVYKYNYFSSCNSLRQIETYSPGGEIGYVVEQSICIIKAVSKLLRIPATYLLPAVAYPVPILSSLALQKLSDYSRNTGDVEYFAQLLYIMPCKLGNLAQQLSQVFRYYRMAFFNTKWVFALFCLFYSSPETELYRIGLDIFATNIQFYLANPHYQQFWPLTMSISGREVYYKNRASSGRAMSPRPPVPQTVTKLIKTKHSLYMWESLSFRVQQETKAKIRCLGANNTPVEFQHDYFYCQLLTNYLGYCTMFDYYKNDYFQRLSNQIKVSNQRSYFRFPEDELQSYDLLIDTSNQLKYQIYFPGELQHFKKVSYQFQLKKDEYISLVVDETRYYNAEEVSLERQDRASLIVAYM